MRWKSLSFLKIWNVQRVIFCYMNNLHLLLLPFPNFASYNNSKMKQCKYEKCMLHDKVHSIEQEWIFFHQIYRRRLIQRKICFKSKSECLLQKIVEPLSWITHIEFTFTAILYNWIVLWLRNVERKKCFDWKLML